MVDDSIWASYVTPNSRQKHVIPGYCGASDLEKRLAVPGYTLCTSCGAPTCAAPLRSLPYFTGGGEALSVSSSVGVGIGAHPGARAASLNVSRKDRGVFRLFGLRSSNLLSYGCETASARRSVLASDARAPYSALNLRFERYNGRGRLNGVEQRRSGDRWLGRTNAQRTRHFERPACGRV